MGNEHGIFGGEMYRERLAGPWRLAQRGAGETKHGSLGVESDAVHIALPDDRLHDALDPIGGTSSRLQGNLMGPDAEKGLCPAGEFGVVLRP
jgi:hypothetical protein